MTDWKVILIAIVGCSLVGLWQYSIWNECRERNSFGYCVHVLWR